MKVFQARKNYFIDRPVRDNAVVVYKQYKLLLLISTRLVCVIIIFIQ